MFYLRKSLFLQKNVMGFGEEIGVSSEEVGLSAQERQVFGEEIGLSPQERDVFGTHSRVRNRIDVLDLSKHIFDIDRDIDLCSVLLA
ncbi:unnamed protein product [Didymodactylos carnosus]|uniref:Uncharacterized protein n=1 Tax=Didymodactylos carnosus TaxID=1234261 RepID=A0A8S2EBM8_9BILA|nr:unnamed protein product [Didymodactylos carnosus]CAF3867102.1 unnamed protein product [Didymodactylos carnosus]